MNIKEYHQEFNKALQRLIEATEAEDTPLNRDATIQRFEFTYELAWKLLKKLLATKDIDVRSPKETLQTALQQGYIQNGSDWTELHKNRNLTIHTYDQALAEEVYRFVIQSAVSLFQQLNEIQYD